MSHDLIGVNQEVSPSQLVAGLAPQDKATIMSLCMPSGANDSELALFLYRCKEQGFDPLSGELVLQKRISQKDGSVSLSFITTRDALLRKAELNPNYEGISSGVVKENDEFSIDTEKGIVQQKIGAKRGKILIGWAVVRHKSRLPVIAVVDYSEYAVANSRSPVWQAMPSAMIQKVAEVSALRRQFPILTQGVYTSDEMQMQGETTTMPEISATVVEKVVEFPTGAVRMLNDEPELKQAPVSEPKIEPKAEPEAQGSVGAPEVIPPTEQAEVKAKAEAQPQDAYKLVKLSTGRTGAGVPYARIACEKDGKGVILFGKDEEGLLEASKLHDGCFFKAEFKKDGEIELIKTITVL
jgi:phage recombination protein Bet